MRDQSHGPTCANSPRRSIGDNRLRAPLARDRQLVFKRSSESSMSNGTEKEKERGGKKRRDFDGAPAPRKLSRKIDRLIESNRENTIGRAIAPCRARVYLATRRLPSINDNHLLSMTTCSENLKKISRCQAHTPRYTVLNGAQRELPRGSDVNPRKRRELANFKEEAERG